MRSGTQRHRHAAAAAALARRLQRPRSLAWCATVRRTPEIDRLRALDLPRRANDFAAGLDDLLRDRALAWAYLDETRASYAIERETPADDRTRAFVALLHQAHLRTPLSEDYLAGLQRSAVSNPLDRALGFRTGQNWLQGPLRGSAGVTYVPPPPALAHELMQALMAFANAAPAGRDAMVAAAVISSGFVLIHPFMDGNGRLSRFLFHHALCRSGELADGLILPVSVAMKKHEADYLRALRTFSAPARDRWNVERLGGDDFRFHWTGDAAWSLYRYWDATGCVAFGLRMAESALEVELRQETAHLQRFDRIVRAVGDAFDLRGSDLATLVTACLDQGGTLSKRRRAQFAATVPEAAFALIETATRKALGE